MRKIKYIKRQDSGFKLSYGNSGETSLNLSNEIFDFISQGNINRGEEKNITFKIYKEDCVKAMSFIIMKLPLYKSSSNSSNIVNNCLVTFGELYSSISTFFGNTRTADYTVTLFYRTDGRFYLKGLRVKGFSIRDYLVENYSALQFDDEEDGVLKLRILSNIEDDGRAEGIYENQTKEEIDSSIELISSSFRPFITAIKSKPFLLLAGISGTGKSRIVRELARACWDEDSEEFNAQKPKNFEMVQVKPNWHDSSELIGYVSRIDGVRYVVGPFLRFMVKAIQDPNTPYFLCLDEMNLAPVEQYFAEYLSVVESRKRQDDGTITTDPIIDYSNTEEYKSLIDQLFPNDDDLREEYLTENGGKRLRIPNNLIVVGTVNMDETTFSFSRKVLDRAMTIEMNEVDLSGGLDSRHEKIGKLGATELVGTAVEGVDIYDQYKGVCDTVIDYLQKINDKLEGTPFKIAYRTRNETLLYVVNNLPYRHDEDLEEGEVLKEEYVIARALDEITNMKILSRIEGDETKVSKSFLEELSKVIKEELEKISDCAFDIEETDDAYKSVSLAKLDEMKKRLDSGYTSFWS